jgi:hypothetical protein
LHPPGTRIYILPERSIEVPETWALSFYLSYLYVRLYLFSLLVVCMIAGDIRRYFGSGIPGTGSALSAHLPGFVPGMCETALTQAMPFL